MKKFLLLTVLLSGCSLFDDDIEFISPKAGASVTGTLTIEVNPKHDNVDVRVWIEDNSDAIRWSDTLTSANSYKTTVDVSAYTSGKYEIQAKYYKGSKDYDDDVDFWID